MPGISYFRYKIVILPVDSLYAEVIEAAKWRALLSASLKSGFGYIEIRVQRRGFETVPSLSVFQLDLIPSF